jgi:sugar/nucleoside kinase (ribokinase family)
VGFQLRIGDENFGEIALRPLQQSGVNVSRERRTHSAVKTGITVILQRERWRNMVTYAGTIAELAWDDLDFDYLTDLRHFHISSFLSAARAAGEDSRVVSPDGRCWT